jgi:hypothetical protein
MLVFMTNSLERRTCSKVQTTISSKIIFSQRLEWPSLVHTEQYKPCKITLLKPMYNNQLRRTFLIYNMNVFLLLKKSWNKSKIL